MSKRTHEKQLARARARRRQEQGRRRRRTRAIAVAVVLALGAGAFTTALALRGEGDPSTPESALGLDDGASETEVGNETATEPATDQTEGSGEDGETTTAAEPCPSATDAPTPSATPYDAPPDMTIDTSAAYTATIETTCGTIVVELAAQEAPLTVNNFVFLAEDGYYRGVPFHRVIDGFMIQGGDPTGTGRGFTDDPDAALPGYRFQDELDLAQRIVEAEGGYPRGVIAMANAGPDTQGSQFFIMQAPAPYPLEPNYTMFGRVTEGIEIVDRIAAGPVEGDLAVEPVRIIDVTIEVNAASGPGTDTGSSTETEQDTDS